MPVSYHIMYARIISYSVWQCMPVPIIRCQSWLNVFQCSSDITRFVMELHRAVEGYILSRNEWNVVGIVQSLCIMVLFGPSRLYPEGKPQPLKYLALSSDRNCPGFEWSYEVRLLYYHPLFIIIRSCLSSFVVVYHHSLLFIIIRCCL